MWGVPSTPSSHMPLPMNSVSEFFHLHIPSFEGWQRWLLKVYFISHLTLKSVSLFTLVAGKFITMLSSFPVLGVWYASFPSPDSIPNAQFDLPSFLAASAIHMAGGWVHFPHQQRKDSSQERFQNSGRFCKFCYFHVPPALSSTAVCLHTHSLFKILKYLHVKRELHIQWSYHK